MTSLANVELIQLNAEFENSGLKITCFNSGAECLEQLRRKRCDLLITDLKMPRTEGIELLTRARALGPWLPVLVITGYGDIHMAVKAGVVDFIEKSLIKGDIVRLVKMLLEESRRLNPNVVKPITNVESRVLQMIVDGKSNKQIANLLHRSIRIRTIEVHAVYPVLRICRAELLTTIGIRCTLCK